MNLFRRHKKFEDQLQEQLGDMEMKPSKSLWDRIDSDITSDSFEHGVKGNLENFEQIPSPETWKKIEAELPEKAPGNSMSKYYVSAVLALLFSVGVFIGQKWQSATMVEEAKQEPTNLPVDGKSMKPTEPLKDELTLESILEEEAKQGGTPYAQLQTEPQQLAIVTPAPTTIAASTTTQTHSPEPVVNEVAVVVANTKPEVFTETNNKADVSEPIQIVQESGVIKTTHEEPDPLVSNKTPETNASEVQVPPVPETTLIAAQQPKEVQLVQTDSAAYAQKVEALNNRPDLQQEQLTKVSLSIYAGLNLGLTTYSAPNQASGLDFEKNINLRKELERPEVDWAGGFLVDVRTGKRWMISAGVMMVNFSQRFEYSIEKALQPAENEWGATLSNPTDSFVTGNQYSDQIKYSWTEIPVFVNYTILRKNNWNIDMQAGVSYAFINLIDGGMIGYDNKGVLVLNNKESFPNIRNTVFVTAMPQVSYQFSPTVAVGLAPSVKYSLTSIIGNERWIQQHPYFLGMNICLRKRF